MKVDMLKDGTLVITAQTGAEEFALQQWRDKAFFAVDDRERMLKEHVNPFYISLQVEKGAQQ